MTKLKVFADDNFKIAKMTISNIDRVEDVVGNGQNAGHQHFFSFSPSVFQSHLSKRLLIGIVW